MKRIAIAVGVALLVLTVAVSAQTQAQQYKVTKRGTVEQELRELEKNWGDAVVKHDWAFLDQILADDCTWTGPDGKVWSKTQTLASLKSGEDVVSSSETDDLMVRVYGDTAVVTGRTTVKEQYKGKDISGQYRWTDMWVKDYAGRWRCVADHSSRIDAQK